MQGWGVEAEALHAHTPVLRGGTFRGNSPHRTSRTIRSAGHSPQCVPRILPHTQGCSATRRSLASWYLALFHTGHARPRVVASMEVGSAANALQ